MSDEKTFSSDADCYIPCAASLADHPTSISLTDSAMQLAGRKRKQESRTLLTSKARKKSLL